MKNQIKYLQNLFYEMLNDYGKVFIIVTYSELTKIDNRGFTAEEKKDLFWSSPIIITGDSSGPKKEVL